MVNLSDLLKEVVMVEQSLELVSRLAGQEHVGTNIEIARA